MDNAVWQTDIILLNCYQLFTSDFLLSLNYSAIVYNKRIGASEFLWKLQNVMRLWKYLEVGSTKTKHLVKIHTILLRI